MEDLNDILKLSGMKTKTVKKNLNESYTNEPDETYASVDSILQQGTDLNRPKSQHAVAGFTGDNPMTEGGADVDEDAVRELKIYIDHNADLYSQNMEPILRNLSRKWDKGVYDHELAQKLFYYLTVNGAKQYGQEHSNGDGLRIFSPDTRRAVAKELADDWLAELKAGNKMDEAEIDLEEMLADILISEDAFDDIRSQSDKAFSSIRKSSDDAFSSIRGKDPRKPELTKPKLKNLVRPGERIGGGPAPSPADLDLGALEKIVGRYAKPPKGFPGFSKGELPKPMPTEPKRPKFGKSEPEYVKPLEEKDSTKRLSDKEIWDQTPAASVSRGAVAVGKQIKKGLDWVKDKVTGND